MNFKDYCESAKKKAQKIKGMEKISIISIDEVNEFR